MLSALEPPIAVLAVAGKFRTGKSFLLNRLLGQQHGFEVGPTVEACTHGLMLWGTPVRGTLDDGTACTIVVMDTEGLGGHDKNEEYDARVFSLATLLCSTLVYNSMGTIDEKAIASLSFVAKLSRYIQISADRGVAAEDDEDEDAESSEITATFFPRFFWIVRDFALSLEHDDGDEMTEQDYLETALAEADGFSEAVMARNATRTTIKSFFRQRECATLVRPVDDEADLQRLDTLPFEDLRPVFQDEMNAVRARVLNHIKAKTFRGANMSGAMLYDLAVAFVGAINR